MIDDRMDGMADGAWLIQPSIQPFKPLVGHTVYKRRSVFMTTYFNKPFGRAAGQLPVEANRYRLIWSVTCPFAQRVAIARQLLGLEDIVSLATTHPVNAGDGWQFSLAPAGIDPVLGVPSLPALYQQAAPDYDGPFSVPTLVDTQSQTIVRKESLEILRDFSTAFKPLHAAKAPDLYPEPLRQEIDEWNQKLTTSLLNGLNKIGCAQDQASYDAASEAFFTSLQEIDARLANRPYFHGHQLTETDIVLYTPLVRLEIFYAPVFGANKHSLRDFPNLWSYLRNLYAHPAFRDTTDFEAIKTGSYLGKIGQTILQRPVVPAGPDLSHWSSPRQRTDDTYHFWS